MTPGRLRRSAAVALGLGFAVVHLSGGVEKVVRAGLGAEWLGGYPPWSVVLVGGIEIACGLALLVPRGAAGGALGLSVLAGGRIGALAHDGTWADLPWVLAQLVGLTWVVHESWGRRGTALRPSSAPSPEPGTPPDEYFASTTEPATRGPGA